MDWIDFIVQVLSKPKVIRDEWPKEQAKRKKKGTKEKADWYTGEGVAMRERQVDEQTFESERMDKPELNRNATLTNEEIEILEERGLKEETAARVKPYWAKGQSAAAAADKIKERGYGERTLDNYWAVFNLLSGEGLT